MPCACRYNATAHMSATESCLEAMTNGVVVTGTGTGAVRRTRRLTILRRQAHVAYMRAKQSDKDSGSVTRPSHLHMPHDAAT